MMYPDTAHECYLWLEAARRALARHTARRRGCHRHRSVKGSSGTSRASLRSEFFLRPRPPAPPLPSLARPPRWVESIRRPPPTWFRARRSFQPSRSPPGRARKATAHRLTRSSSQCWSLSVCIFMVATRRSKAAQSLPLMEDQSTESAPAPISEGVARARAAGAANAQFQKIL